MISRSCANYPDTRQSSYPYRGTHEITQPDPATRDRLSRRCRTASRREGSAQARCRLSVRRWLRLRLRLWRSLPVRGTTQGYLPLDYRSWTKRPAVHSVPGRRTRSHSDSPGRTGHGDDADVAPDPRPGASQSRGPDAGHRRAQTERRRQRAAAGRSVGQHDDSAGRDASAGDCRAGAALGRSSWRRSGVRHPCWRRSGDRLPSWRLRGS